MHRVLCSCWLNDIYVLLAAIPFGIMFLAVLVFCFLICIQDKFKLLKHVDDERTTTSCSHSSFFNMSVFVCVLFLGKLFYFPFWRFFSSGSHFFDLSLKSEHMGICILGNDSHANKHQLS
jgi:hypothetical protein